MAESESAMSGQAQLTFDGLPDPPRIGEWLRCIENGRWAEVVEIASVGFRTTIGLPLYVGDIVMRFGPGVYRVSSPGKFFWERWQRVELDALAKEAIRIALEEH
jgi:hypothetical protein